MQGTYRTPSWVIENWILSLYGLIQDHPGIWTARLCRMVNGLDESEASIIYCVLCSEYANPRKRARAETYARRPTLPAMAPPYQLHRPCTRLRLRQVQHCLRRLETELCMVIGLQADTIPDSRNGRGWDLATTWYDADNADRAVRTPVRAIRTLTIDAPVLPFGP